MAAGTSPAAWRVEDLRERWGATRRDLARSGETRKRMPEAKEAGDQGAGMPTPARSALVQRQFETCWLGVFASQMSRIDEPPGRGIVHRLRSLHRRSQSAVPPVEAGIAGPLLTHRKPRSLDRCPIIRTVPAAARGATPRLPASPMRRHPGPLISCSDHTIVHCTAGRGKNASVLPGARNERCRPSPSGSCSSDWPHTPILTPKKPTGWWLGPVG